MPPTDSADLVLHYAPRSRCFTILWFLEELGRPYRLEPVDIRTGEQKSPEFLKINPMGKVPAVRDGDVAVAECGAILAWLADRYSAGQLAPRTDGPDRAAYLRWLFFAAGVMEPAFGQKFFDLDLPASRVGWGSFEAMQSVVTDALSGREWFAGGRFTAADLYVGANLHFGVTFGILPQEGPIADYVAAHRPAGLRARHGSGGGLPRRARAGRGGRFADGMISERNGAPCRRSAPALTRTRYFSAARTRPLTAARRAITCAAGC